MSIEHARTYLAKVLPWPQEGDELPSYVNIHWSLTKLDQHGKTIWTGRATRNVDEAVRTVAWALKGADTKDIYVCMSSQAEMLERTSKKGNTYLQAIRSQENVVALKSLFLDLDAKGSDKNSYGTLSEAIGALTDFIAKVGLPHASAIVSSGGGLHVYWTFDRALTRDEWQPLAYALAEATKQHGLKCDTQCTIDAARILRVPGTFNRKLDVPRPVTLAGGRVGHDYSVERIEKSLEPYRVAIPASQQSVLPRRPPLQGESELSMGVDRSNAQPVDLNTVLPGCAFLNDAVTSGGKDYSNPLWNLTTLISTFTQGARADAHRMACGHADYTKEATDDLYDRKERERQTKGLGWPSCRTISGSGASQCAACPHYVQGKSPLNLATRTLVAVAAAPNPGSGVPPNANGVGAVVGASALGTAPASIGSMLPAGYKANGRDVVLRVLVNTDGTTQEQELCSYPMTKPWLMPEPEWTLNFNTITQVGQTSQVAVTMKDCSSKERLRGTLLSRGMAVRESESKHLMEFFMSWIQELQKRKDAIISYAPFGWATHSNGKLEGFIYGGQKFTPLGTTGAANPDPNLQRQYRPRGDRKYWIEAAKLITAQKRPALDAIIASAFAAPLMHFTFEPGVVMSVYSQESGVGKTTALRIAQAVWGDPKGAMQGTDDTPLSVSKKMGKIVNLPIYWDEIKSEDDHKRFAKLVFDMTKGKEKSRLSQSAELKQAGEWETIMVSASNGPIVDHIMAMTKQTLAGVYRVFEFEVPPGKGGPGQIDPNDAARIQGQLFHSFGQIGLEYAEFLGKHFDQVEQHMEDFSKEVTREFKLLPEERFWRVMVATLLMGATYANTLKFTEIDLKALKKFLFSVIEGMRRQRDRAPVDMRVESNISNVLAQFINQMRARHTLTTNIIHRKPGKAATGTVKVVGDTSKLDAIYVHIGQDDKVVRISMTYLSQWLEKEGYSKHMFTKSMRTELQAHETYGRIGAGTHLAAPSERLLEIDLTKTTHVNFLDEV